MHYLKKVHDSWFREHFMCLQTTVPVLTPPLHVWIFQRKWKHVWNFTHSITARCREWAFQRYCRMENVLRLRLKWQTSAVSLNILAISSDLVLPPTLALRARGSLAQDPPFGLDACVRLGWENDFFLNYSDKYNQKSVHNASPQINGGHFSPPPNNLPSKQGNLLDVLDSCLMFWLQGQNIELYVT